MTYISPYLQFNGKCREAFEFYKECFGGELVLQRVGDSPMAGQMPPAVLPEDIMHAALTNGGLVLMGTDMGADDLVIGNMITLTVHCSSEEEINRFFSKLSQGGEVKQPLADQFWGAIYGQLTDKYGISWSMNYDKPKV